VAKDLDAFATLPGWLVDLTDGARVRSELEAVVPESRTGALEFLACDAKRLRLKPGAWGGSYEVTVRARDDAEPRKVRLRGATLAHGAEPPMTEPDGASFGDDAWQAYLPALGLTLRHERPDVALPALPVLTDPALARDLLERSIAERPGYEGFRLESCTPRVMRYKPGSRCTVLYRLDYAAEVSDRGWPEIVVAKTYHGDKGRVAWDGMRAVWDSPMRSSGVTVAEPLAFLPDINVLVQGPIKEELTLKEQIVQTLAAGTPSSRDELSVTVRAAAAGLAALHACGVTHGELVTWEDELAEVREVAERIAALAPEVSGAADSVLERLVDLAVSVPSDQPRAAHRSFRPAQVLISCGAIGFIDFDGFCQAEPALDVALFRTTVKLLGWKPEHIADLTEIADEFLAEYSRHIDVSPVRVALWESLDLLTQVLHCWTKVKPEKLADAMAAIEHQLAAEPLALST
jgi:Ser/Thr protein kinase RdoA (MazF antagonist)